MSISLISGNNGIGKKANDSKIATEQGQILEKIRLEMYENNLDIENDVTEIDFLKLKGIIIKEIVEEELGELGQVASINSRISIAKAESSEGKNIYYIVDVEKLIDNPATGKGTWETGDIYYILNGYLYYKSRDMKSQMVGKVFTEIEEEGIKWIYYEDENGDIVITGVDCSDYTGYGKSVYGFGFELDMEILVIPEKLDGKNVVGLSFNRDEFIFPETLDDQFRAVVFGKLGDENLHDVKVGDSPYLFNSFIPVSLPKSLRFIDNRNFSVYDVVVYFKNGKNENLEIPADKWGADKIIIKGEEYIN